MIQYSITRTRTYPFFTNMIDLALKRNSIRRLWSFRQLKVDILCMVVGYTRIESIGLLSVILIFIICFRIFIEVASGSSPHSNSFNDSRIETGPLKLGPRFGSIFSISICSLIGPILFSHRFTLFLRNFLNPKHIFLLLPWSLRLRRYMLNGRYLFTQRL